MLFPASHEPCTFPPNCALLSSMHIHTQTPTQASCRPDTMLQLPARIDHLAGTACIHTNTSFGGGGGKNEHSSDSGSKHTAAKVGEV